MRLTRGLGLRLFGLWLLVTGVQLLIPALRIAELDPILAILAIISGILIIIG